MDQNDLKSMWHEAHKTTQGNCYDKVNIKESLSMNHSKTITKVLSDVKMKILGYLLGFVLFAGLLIYALVFLGINFSINTLVLFSFIGIFLLIKTTSEINRLYVISIATVNLSVKESLLYFRKKLNRIKTIDFLSYLIYFYTLAIWSTYYLVKDIGGVKNWSRGNAMLPLLVIVILLMLLIPWLIKYQHNLRYKKLYSNLNDSVCILHEAI